MAEYKVLRRHDGDKEYHEGDIREATPADVAHLVDLGVLRLTKGEKADKAPLNKSEAKLPNKAD